MSDNIGDGHPAWAIAKNLQSIARSLEKIANAPYPIEELTGRRLKREERDAED